MKLLIIDDQPQVTDSLKEAIEPAGHECVIYNDPRNAVTRFQKEYFDAVITDLKMPEMDGLQVLKAVHDLRPGTPVIILTGYADTQNTIEAVNLGASAFFQKPIQIQELLNSLKNVETGIEENFRDKIRLNQLKAEKEILSIELKKRINQNLQLVSSLLRLQSYKMDVPSAQKALEAAYQRISDMALIHDRIYSEKNQVKMDLADYIEKYMGTFTKTYELGQKHIELKMNLETVSVDVNHAIPWGLVINELITNAIVHAFTENNGKQNNWIDISLNRDKDNRILLKVSDNGKGLKSGFRIEETGSLGMNLISNIVQYQLNGEMKVESESGTTVQIISREK